MPSIEKHREFLEKLFESKKIKERFPEFLERINTIFISKEIKFDLWDLYGSEILDCLVKKKESLIKKTSANKKEES